MMQGKKRGLGILLLAALMAVTGGILLKGQPVSILWANLKRLNPWLLLPGLAMMFGYVGCEALCTWQILRRLGHRVCWHRCLGYSFVGFYASSITPSATGGQPAQIYYMNRDGVPVAHGALNMMLIASCYQVAALFWGAGAWLFLPSVRAAADGSLGLLLLYGALMMALLTLSMVMLMFLPGLVRKICQAVLGLFSRIGILRDSKTAEIKVEKLLQEYSSGADCVKRNPGLTVRVLLLCLVQQALLFSVPWTVYLAFGLSGTGWVQMAGLEALLTLAVCNLPLPGAVGAAEGSFVKAFAAVFGAELVTPAMLVSRGISFYAFLVISFGAAAAVYLRTRREGRTRALREITLDSRGRSRVRAVEKYLSIRCPSDKEN